MDYDGGGQGHYGARRPGGGYGGGGHKRKRESEPIDPLKQLLHALIYLGDDALPTLEVEEEAVLALVKQVRRESKASEAAAAAVQGMLVDCACDLSTKLPLYALVLGLLNADDPELVRGVVRLACTQFGQALAPDGSPARARLLLRLLAALVPANVLGAAGVLGALRGVVDTALAAAQASPEGDDGRSWQPYCDALVYWALAALPWGGEELAHAAPEQLLGLLEAVGRYMALRPRSTQPSLRPFFAAIKDDDTVAESDNGGASFLGEVYEAVKDLADSDSWQLQAIPRVHLRFEVQLAESTPHNLPAPLAVPAAAPVELPPSAPSALVGALVLEAFPPRGVIRLLDPQHTRGDRPLAERLVAEEYILDTLRAFEPDRTECAKRLAGALPLPFPHEPLLCEVLFGQLLRIPHTQYKPVFYSALMVDLCKLMKLFPRAMSACVRESFARMNVLDVTLRGRLAEWLAYHLSNFEYMWPWAKWAHVLAAPAYDGQRRFCVAVMNRLVRLSYWDRILSILPEEFRPLLPPKPEVGALPSPNDESSENQEGVWAAKMLQMVRSKTSAEDLDQWMVTNDLEGLLGGALGALRCLARTLLVAGAKSYTHMVIALERYYGPLAARVQALGVEGETELVGVACSVWRKSPQRAAMAVDRLMTLRLASAEAIVAWMFGSEGVLRLGDESASALSWEILYNAVNKTCARVQDARDDVKGAQRAAAAAAGGALDEAAASQAQADVQKAQSYLEEATQQQEGAFLQVLHGFVRLLAGSGGEGEGEGAEAGPGAEAMDTEERGAWRDYTHACLRSFVRRYNVQVAQISAQIEDQILGQQGVPPAVRDAIASQLYL